VQKFFCEKREKKIQQKEGRSIPWTVFRIKLRRYKGIKKPPLVWTAAVKILSD
jgi:hypothetical protein